MRHFSVDALYVYHETLPVRKSQERLRRTPTSKEFTAGRRCVGSETSGGRGSNSGVGGRNSDDTESHAKNGGGSGSGGGGGEGVGLKRVNRPPVNTLRLDVPELSSDLDSHQVCPR